MKQTKFTIRPGRIFIALLACIVVLGAAHVVSQLYIEQSGLPLDSSRFVLISKLGLDVERAFGTWFSQAMLLGTAFLLFVLCLTRRKQRNKDAVYWGVLAAIFTYLSIDESVSLHELAMEPTRSSLGIEQGYLFFAWIIPALFILLVVGLFFVRFWWRLPIRTRIMFVVSLVVFLSGAVVMEMLGGNHASASTMSESLHDTVWVLLILAEEALEMLGVAIFIHELLVYMALPGKNLVVTLQGGSTKRLK